MVALLCDAADRALAAGAHPDRRMRLLPRRRLDDNIVKLPIFALMRERPIGSPCLEDHLKAFVEACVGFLHLHAEAGEFVVVVTLADAEIEPAAGEEIERSRLLGQQYRIVPGQHDDRGAETQPACACAKPGQQVQRRRNLAISGEMVLDDKGAVKAERLGLDIVFDEIAEPLAAVELGAAASCGGTAEQTELHSSYPSVAGGPRFRARPGASSRASR